MKKFTLLFLSFVFLMMLFGITETAAQCAMCASTVESSVQSGDKTAEGLNKGILFLLSAPYLAVAALGYLWYKKYRKKDVRLNTRNEKLHLN
jgi:hypothetical protein